MCYVVVQYTEYRCGHRHPTRRQKIDCNKKSCRFSQEHTEDSHDCGATCIQKMIADQGLIMDVETVPCGSCV